MEPTSENKKSNGTWQAAVGAAFGAAIGASGEAVAATVVKQSHAQADAPAHDDDVQVVQPHAQPHVAAQPDDDVQPVNVKTDDDVTIHHPVPTPAPTPTPTPGPVDSSHIEVISCETTVIDGQNVEVAHVVVDGHEGVVIDTDMDGIADEFFLDSNDDQNLQDNEVMHLQALNINIPMANLEAAVGVDPHPVDPTPDPDPTPEPIDPIVGPQTDDHLITQQTGHVLPDYTNDGEHDTGQNVGTGEENMDYNNHGNVENFMA